MGVRLLQRVLARSKRCLRLAEKCCPPAIVILSGSMAQPNTEKRTPVFSPAQAVVSYTSGPTNRLHIGLLERIELIDNISDAKLKAGYWGFILPIPNQKYSRPVHLRVRWAPNVLHLLFDRTPSRPSVNALYKSISIVTGSSSTVLDHE